MGVPHEYVSPKYSGQSDFIFVPVLFINQKVKNFFKTINVTAQLVSNNGFRTEQEALNFIPFFINEKIKSKDIPKEFIKHDKDGKEILDQEQCRAGYIKVKLSILELEPE